MDMSKEDSLRRRRVRERERLVSTIVDGPDVYEDWDRESAQEREDRLSRCRLCDQERAR